MAALIFGSGGKSMTAAPIELKISSLSEQRSSSAVTADQINSTKQIQVT
jgi:hypothetical protein